MSYLERTPPRTAAVSARITQADRRLLEVAAEAAGASLSAFVAEAAVGAARRELLHDHEKAPRRGNARGPDRAKLEGARDAPEST